jgi:phosphate-selective porin OprO/OprP
MVSTISLIFALLAPEPVLDTPPPPEPSEPGTPSEPEATEPSETESETETETEPVEPEAAAKPAPEPPEPEPEPEPEPTEAAAEPPPAAEPSAEEKCRAKASPLVPRRELDMLCPENEVDPATLRYKPGTGLVITSKNKRFQINMRMRMQLLGTLENRDDKTLQGLQIRRARLAFKGYVFNENIGYKTELAFAPSDLNYDGVPHQTPIFDWFFDITYLRDLQFRIGQYKVPFNRVRVVSSADLELVDRSIANAEFNLDRDIGADFHSDDFLGLGKLRYNAGVWAGEGRDLNRLDTFELMYIGRAEYLPFGDFEDYKEGDFERTPEPRLSLGFAYAFVDQAKRNRGILGAIPTDGGTLDSHNWTGDVVFKISGFSLTSEVYVRSIQRNYGDATVLDELGNEVPAEREAPRNGLGWYVQAGYLIPHVPLGIAGRYTQIRKRRFHGNPSSLPESDEAGGGLSWYFAQHPLKLQLDYFHVWEPGMVAEGADRVRLQAQVGF